MREKRLRDRYRSCLLGLACGDAVGTTVEFRVRGTFPPVTDMVGGGPFSLKPGQWTDDTSMALCLAESLIVCKDFNAVDQMQRYVNWWQQGYLSSTGKCFDIGGTTVSALRRFLANGESFAGSTDPNTAGNGSLMRLAPVVLFAHPNRELVFELSAESSRTTHAAPEAVECCSLLGLIISRALVEKEKQDVLCLKDAFSWQPSVAAIAAGEYLEKSRTEIRGTAYCIESLEAALWCFATTSSFSDAILKAVNLGDDSDTTAAITGQIAGAFYGYDSIPTGWLNKVWMRNRIEGMADSLFALANQ